MSNLPEFRVQFPMTVSKTRAEEIAQILRRKGHRVMLLFTSSPGPRPFVLSCGTSGTLFISSYPNINERKLDYGEASRLLKALRYYD